MVKTIKYSNPWLPGDLIVSTRTHTIIRCQLCHNFNQDTFSALTDANIKETADYQVREDEIEKGCIVIALENCPPAGTLASIKILHKDSTWFANSNWFAKAQGLKDNGNDKNL